MATFTYTASFAATEDSRPRVRATQFGDGYSQRIRFGLNTDAKIWRLSFANRTDSERESIVTFLQARNGVESFDWAPPRGAAGKYICSEWSVEMINYNNNTVNATFIQVFEP